MEQSLAVFLGVTAMLLWVWGYALVTLYRLVLPALRTGILQARGRTYSRTDDPVMFWGGIAFWIGLVVMLTFPAVMAFQQAWQRFLG